MSIQTDGNQNTRPHAVPDSPDQTEVTVTPTRGRSRPRVAISLLTAGVLIAGTAVGIQRLASSREVSTALEIPPTPEPTSTPELSNTASVSTLAPSVPGPPADGGDSALAGMATPAQLVPANITWTVLPVDSSEALAYRFDGSQRYALSTIPSTSPEDPTRFELFQQLDGKWNQVAFDNRDGVTPYISGDTVFGLGTAPATTGGPSGSFGVFDTASATWQLHPLPDPAVPYSSDKVSADQYFEAAPIEGGLVVAIMNRYDLRSEQDRVRLGAADVGPLVVDDKIAMFSNCDFAARDEVFRHQPPREMSWEKVIELNRQTCTTKTYDPAEFGLSQADLTALAPSWAQRPSTTWWKMTADSMVPFTVPGVTSETSDAFLFNRRLIVPRDGPGSQNALYVVGHDGSLTRVFDDLPLDAMNGNLTSFVASPDDTTVVGGVDHYLLTEVVGRSTLVTDVFGAFASPEMVNPAVDLQPIGVAGPLSVSQAHVWYDPAGTLAGPNSVSDSGYTLIMDGADAVQVIDDATGANVDFEYTLSTESGKVALLRYSESTTPAGATPDGSIPATTTNTEVLTVDPEPLATFDIDWRAVPGLNTRWRDIVVTSDDGVNVALSDINSVVGQHVDMSGDEIVSMSPFEITDGRIMVRVEVGSRQTTPDGAPIGPTRDYLVIGTPM